MSDSGRLSAQSRLPQSDYYYCHYRKLKCLCEYEDAPENRLDLISDPHRRSLSETETLTPAEGHIHSEWRKNRTQLRP